MSERVIDRSGGIADQLREQARGAERPQLDYADPRVAPAVWAADADSWVASPCAPQGVASPVDRATRTAVWRMPSTCQARPTTPRPSVRWVWIRTGRCGR